MKELTFETLRPKIMVMLGSKLINSPFQLDVLLHIDEQFIHGLDSYIFQANEKSSGDHTQNSSVEILEENDILNHLEEIIESLIF